MEEVIETSFEALTIDQQLDVITHKLFKGISYVISNIPEDTFKFCARTALYNVAACNFGLTYGKLAALVVLDMTIGKYSHVLLNTAKKAADYISEACVEL